jgi:uncharacterized membrane protein YuzA (DUF378 family)
LCLYPSAEHCISSGYFFGELVAQIFFVIVGLAVVPMIAYLMFSNDAAQ